MMDEELILNHIQGRLSPEEKKELLDWIDTSESNKDYYTRMRQLWDLSILTGQYDNKENDRAYSKVLDDINKQPENYADEENTFRRIGSILLKIAAVVLIAFSTSWGVIYFNKQHSPVNYNYVEVPLEQRVKLILSDGSTVWLNSGTHFRYPDHFSGKNRVVKLDGEAQFNVNHNEEHPFVVETSSCSVQVLGTAFNIFAYDESNKFEATLMEGHIQLNLDDNKNKKVMMKSGEQAVYNKSNKQVTLSKDVNTGIIDAWIDGYYHLDKVPFGEMIERLSHYYGKKITIANPQLANYECTGKFKYGESLEHVLSVVKVTKPFTYKVVNDEIIIN